MFEETPIVRQLVKHVERSRFPLHVPGHQQGRVLPEVLSTWLGPAALFDLTELPGLDNLHGAKECIAESAALTAAYYGSDQCLYSVNGSSAGVMAAISGVARDGNHVLFLNPFHVSAWRGLIQAGAKALLPTLWFGNGSDRLAVPAVEDVEQVLTAHHERSDIAAVYLTSPTYRGTAADVGAIARLVHEFGLPLIVDEAHGAHFGLHRKLPPHSVACGADVVIHSVHKTLPGLTQVAWVHVQKQRVESDRVRDALLSLTTTSPSYLFLASLDAAQAWLRTEGKAAAQRAYEILRPVWSDAYTASESARTPHQDFLRRLEPTRDLAASLRFQTYLEQAGLFPEYADADGVLSIFGFGVTEGVIECYLDIMARWRREEGLADRTATEEMDSRVPGMDAGDVVAFAVPPREAWLADHVSVPLWAASGRIAARPITPYPPGVPVVWPGQSFDAQTLELLQDLARSGTDVHGLKADGTLAVLDEGVVGRQRG